METQDLNPALWALLPRDIQHYILQFCNLRDLNTAACILQHKAPLCRAIWQVKKRYEDLLYLVKFLAENRYFTPADFDIFFLDNKAYDYQVLVRFRMTEKGHFSFTQAHSRRVLYDAHLRSLAAGKGPWKSVGKERCEEYIQFFKLGAYLQYHDTSIVRMRVFPLHECVQAIFRSFLNTVPYFDFSIGDFERSIVKGPIFEELHELHNIGSFINWRNHWKITSVYDFLNEILAAFSFKKERTRMVDVQKKIDYQKVVIMEHKEEKRHFNWGGGEKRIHEKVFLVRYPHVIFSFSLREFLREEEYERATLNNF